MNLLRRSSKSGSLGCGAGSVQFSGGASSGPDAAGTLSGQRWAMGGRGREHPGPPSGQGAKGHGLGTGPSSDLVRCAGDVGLVQGVWAGPVCVLGLCCCVRAMVGVLCSSALGAILNHREGGGGAGGDLRDPPTTDCWPPPREGGGGIGHPPTHPPTQLPQAQCLDQRLRC